MKREQRLQSGKHWLSTLEPGLKYISIVKRYKKKYKVDIICAIIELKKLGVQIPDEYLINIKKQKEVERINKKDKQEIFEYEDNDDIFFYIAGYTSGGMPYGITYDEIQDDGFFVDKDSKDDLPF